MPKMSGWLDDDFRPLLRMAVPDGNPILVQVDTGFNGDVWITKNNALACGIDFDEVYERTGYLAGMRPVHEAFARWRVLWFGSLRIVSVSVDLDSDYRTVQAGEPVALIGMSLINPATLTINCEKRTVLLRHAGSMIGATPGAP